MDVSECHVLSAGCEGGIGLDKQLTGKFASIISFKCDVAHTVRSQYTSDFHDARVAGAAGAMIRLVSQEYPSRDRHPHWTVERKPEMKRSGNPR